MIDYLKQFSGKTVDEVIKIEEEKELKTFLKERNKQKKLDEVLQHSYYKITFDSSVFIFVRFLSKKSFTAECINITINDQVAYIEFEKKKSIRPDWFVDKNWCCIIKKIDESAFDAIKNQCKNITEQALVV